MQDRSLEKAKSIEGVQGTERDPVILKGQQDSWTTGRKDTQWPQEGWCSDLLVTDSSQSQAFITKEGLGQKQLLCKVAGD